MNYDTSPGQFPLEFDQGHFRNFPFELPLLRSLPPAGTARTKLSQTLRNHETNKNLYEAPNLVALRDNVAGKLKKNYSPLSQHFIGKSYGSNFWLYSCES